MQFFIHKNCFELFYLLIFYFGKFSTWIWCLPFAVYVRRKNSLKGLPTAPTHLKPHIKDPVVLSEDYYIMFLKED